MDHISQITKAAQERKTINIVYRKLAKKSIVRETKSYNNLEVYEIRGDRVFAYDPSAGHIKQFRVCSGLDDDGIMYVDINETKFEPKYEVKV